MFSPKEDLAVLFQSSEMQNNKLRRISLMTALNSLILVLTACALCCWVINEIMGKLPNIVPRSEWKSSYSKFLDDTNEKLLELPVDRVIITNMEGAPCDTQADCIYYLQIMDVGSFINKTYNFMIGGDGSIYEGSGWEHMGQHTEGYDNKSIAIAFIGTFVHVKPPRRQFDALQLLLIEGVRARRLTIDYKIWPQGVLDFRPNNPGDNIVNVIKEWSHYVD